MSGAPSGPNQSFHERLNRVAEHRAPAEAEMTPVDVLPDWKRGLFGKSGMVFAVLSGVLAVILVRIAMFHTTGQAMVSENADMTLAIETVAALILSFILFLVLPFKGVQYKFAQFGGVVLMISMMHNAVHSVPSIFSAMFSPEWTIEVTEVTEPNSLYLRGEIIHFVKPEPVEEEAPVMPKVRKGV